MAKATESNTAPAPAAHPVPSDAPLTLAEARNILSDMEDELYSIEHLGRVVWLAAIGLKSAGGGSEAIGEIGEMIEQLARKIRKDSYAWCRLETDDDGNGAIEESAGDVTGAVHD